MSKMNSDILIVGAGPTGLTLACTLAKQGINCRIIDKRSTSSEISRAINISQPTLDIFKLLGIKEQFWSDGLKLDALIGYWNKRRLFKIDYRFTKMPYPYFFHLEQPKLEIYLNDLLHDLQQQVERRVELVDLTQDKHGVSVVLKHTDGVTEQAHFSYVIGCDGGHSMVRELLHIPCQQNNYSSYFILADAELNVEQTHQKLYYMMSEQGYLIIAPLPENKHRLIASFKGTLLSKDKVDLSMVHFQKILDERGPGNMAITKISWVTSANFYHQLAVNAQDGRVFLAGDALHLFSPVGGTNMNTGIQDAYNLAQKIAFVKKGIHDDHFLMSYQSERLAVAKQIQGATAMATQLITRSACFPEEEKKYFPMMENRKFLKHSLPQLFAGYDFLSK